MGASIASRASKALAFVLFGTLLFALASGPTATAYAADQDQGPALTTQDDKTYSYALGQRVNGTATSYAFYTLRVQNSNYYLFNLSAATDVKMTLVGNVNAYLKSTSGTSYGYLSNGSILNLPAGSYELEIYQTSYDSVAYSFCLGKISHAITITNKVNLKPDTEKEVALKYSGSRGYADSHLKIAKNSNKKVAAGEIVFDPTVGKATLKITPKQMGKTVFTIAMGDAAKKKVAAYVTTTAVYVVKGGKAKLPKPLGVKKLTYKSKKASKVAVNKKGVIAAKAAGRVNVIGKSGSVKYTYKVIVTDYKKLGHSLYRQIKEDVPNPQAFKINYAYRGYMKSGTTKIPVVYMDFSYDNETGGWGRSKVIAWYDDAFDMKWRSASSASTVMSKKSLKPAEYK